IPSNGGGCTGASGARSASRARVRPPSRPGTAKVAASATAAPAPPATLPDERIMIAALFAPKFIVLYLFIASAVYVHYRGRVRHGFFRQLTDHSSLMAPYNTLMYLFSAVPNR